MIDESEEFLGSNLLPLACCDDQVHGQNEGMHR
jgi:hypothetical protein